MMNWNHNTIARQYINFQRNLPNIYRKIKIKQKYIWEITAGIRPTTRSWIWWIIFLYFDFLSCWTWMCFEYLIKLLKIKIKLFSNLRPRIFSRKLVGMGPNYVKMWQLLFYTLYIFFHFLIAPFSSCLCVFLIQIIVLVNSLWY